MPLSDMRRVAAARERTARRGRSRHRFRKVIRSGSHPREPFNHAGFDVRVVRAGAPRRRQREFAR